MSDPAFVREMERLKMDPSSAGAIKSAKDLYGNPDKAAEIFGKLAKHKSNEPVSKTTLLKTAKDPQALSHAMDLLSSNAEAKVSAVKLSLHVQIDSTRLNYHQLALTVYYVNCI